MYLRASVCVVARPSSIRQSAQKRRLLPDLSGILTVGTDSAQQMEHIVELGLASMGSPPHNVAEQAVVLVL